MFRLSPILLGLLVKGRDYNSISVGVVFVGFVFITNVYFLNSAAINLLTPI